MRKESEKGSKKTLTVEVRRKSVTISHSKFLFYGKDIWSERRLKSMKKERNYLAQRGDFGRLEF